MNAQAGPDDDGPQNETPESVVGAVTTGIWSCNDSEYIDRCGTTFRLRYSTYWK